MQRDSTGLDLIGTLRGMGHPIRWYNMGGGFGIAYDVQLWPKHEPRA